MQETWIWSLGWEDPLEEGIAAHSSILAWRIPWREEPGGLQSMGSQRIGHDWETNKKKKKERERERESQLLVLEMEVKNLKKQELSDWKQKVCLNVKAEYQI